MNKIIEYILFLVCNIDYYKEIQKELVNIKNNSKKKLSSQKLKTQNFPIMMFNKISQNKLFISFMRIGNKIYNKNNKMYIDTIQNDEDKSDENKLEEDKSVEDNLDEITIFKGREYNYFNFRVYNFSIDLLNAFINLIKENERMMIENKYNILNKIHSINFITNKDDLKILHDFNLSQQVPFNSLWVDKNMKYQMFFNYGKIIKECNNANIWLKLNLDFINKLDLFYKNMTKNLLFNIFRKVESKEFPMTNMLIDSKGNFWCLAFYNGESNNIIKKDDIYGNHIYFSIMLEQIANNVKNENNKIIFCLICLGNNPEFIKKRNIKDKSTSGIALRNVADDGYQIYTELIIKDKKNVIPLYSLNLEEGSLNDLKPIIYEDDSINHVSKSFNIYSIDINKIDSC